MEPRPSRPNRPASSASRSQRAPWTPPEGSDDLTAPRSAEIYGPAPASQSGGPWYGPHGSLGPEPPEYRATKPPMPIKPRGERGNKWLRYLLAAVLLLVVVGGAAAAVTWFLNDDDDNGDQTQLAAQTEATPTSEPDEPAPTQTPETMAVPTETPAQAPEPTATTQPEPEEEGEAPPPSADEGEEGAEQDQIASAGESEDETGAGVASSASSFLPDVSELEGTWSVIEEGERTRAEVGEQLGEGGEDQLLSMRWRENLYRDFLLEGGETQQGDTNFLSVSVHRFGTVEGAQQALTVLSDILITGFSYQEMPPVDVGDASVALQAPSNGANLYVLYVQEGNVVIRFGGSSVTGDPSGFVNSIAEQVLANAAA